MGGTSGASYDDLADHFHLIFQDWNRSIGWQAGILGPLLEGQLDSRPLRVLDCACGIGTQSLGLAARGHIVVGTDLSSAAIARARREAAERNLAIRFEVADMRDLSNLDESNFDAILAVDNALPHLLDDCDVSRALEQIRGKLRPGGLLLASIRDYDQIVASHPTTPPPAFFQDGQYRRIYHQMWDWIDDRRYRVHLYITREGPSAWESRHFVLQYRAIVREELTALLRTAGFSSVQWLMPAESGFYQPIALARGESIDKPSASL